MQLRDHHGRANGPQFKNLAGKLHLACCGAKLTLVHATPPLGGRTGEFFDPQGRLDLIAQAQCDLEALQNDVGSRADVLVTDGEPGTVISTAAREVNANLVVIGRSAHSGLLGRLRTHAYAILRQSPCPGVSV
jgi:nucleotide-binding universal stress UspA family protein